jgi:uncharacterized protein
MDEIIRASLVCHLALAKGSEPYVVPLSFGYDGEALYVHTAPEGKKIEYFQSNPHVCFQFERGVELRRDPVTACKWSFNFESVIGYGTVAELLEPAEKQLALSEIMRQYSGKDWPIDEASISHVRVWKIAITSMTGKQSKPPPV